ncbi:hypothetical protein TrLO_g2472 [Triparma laevis f. longispina]|nr:hypothetical protein TrLO_g2472 [Triparma laevis f. longispina]
MTPIAYITTPFTKRTGCPRQPTLCPHSIATINLQKDCHPDTIQGLEQYSHCWVIFTFDNNTDVRTHKNNYKAKITPPRIRPAGTKVGCMSTRTPHRPNNVGLSLLTIKSVSGRTITVSGVDLCDQTPIYDIKPYVPWDVAGYISGGRWGGEMCGVVQCPDWVWDSEALEYMKRASNGSNGSNGYGSPLKKIKTEEIVRIECVTWTDEAVEQLTREHQKGAFKPLYPSRKSDVNTVQLAISEILSQDPRHNRQKGTATNEEGYKVVFCAAQVRFVVGDDKKTEVVEISKVNFEEGDGDGRMKLFKK